MSLPDIETLIVELTLASSSDSKEKEKRHKLIREIEEYFGEEDAQIVLAIALYFRRPSQHFYLYKDLMEVLSDEDECQVGD